ncbi:MAG TPA: ABC transporter ATP-binding protein [Candidatus Merdivicinus faecavium]|nr:ABC transporter ATP-binding protein [Candidatus Merdivicinus faecavium]
MLTLQNVCAGYGGTEILHDISFTLPLGENLCILGPNGCGKTTLLKAIAALIDSKGTVEIDGKPVRSMKRAEIASRIAVMSQMSEVYFSFTVYETVMMGRYQQMKRGLFNSPAPRDREVVERCLAHTNLTALRDRQISELSGGQLQRVFLARTLAQEPEIILLDEPTNHLDLKHQTELVAYLKEWSREENRTIIGVLHDINLSLNLSDRLMFMKDGRVAGLGPASALLRRDFLREIYGMDVVEYMLRSLEKWKDLSDSPERPGEPGCR